MRFTPSYFAPFLAFALLPGCGESSFHSIVGSGGASSSGGSSSGSGAAPGTGGMTSVGGAIGSGGTGGDSGGTATGGTGAGGSGGDASSGGAGGSSVGGSGGNTDSRCGQLDLLLCDGFEAGSIDTNLWSVQKGGAADVVEVATDKAARGNHSVHISTQNGYGFLKNQSAFPVPNNDYFGRMFIYVDAFSTVDWAHWTIAEAAGTGDGSLIRVGGQYNTSIAKNRWGVGSDGGPTGDWTTHDADPAGAVLEPKSKEWVCIEWEHKGSTNETRFFVDGEEHPSLATSATNHGGTSAVDYVLPNMTSLWFGWYQYQDDPMRFEIWIDELAIDEARIGCD